MTLSIQQIEELLSKIETESVYPDPWEDTSCDIIRQLIKERNAYREVAIESSKRWQESPNQPHYKCSHQDYVDCEANRLAGESKCK